MPGFVALDFETANYRASSACEVALVRVEAGGIVAELSFRIRPPSPEFVPFFSALHGITWDQVKDEPDFAQRWPEIRRFLAGADFVAAHNARFDRAVLAGTCAHYGLAPPSLRFLCTVALARRVWGLFPTKLPRVCKRLGVPLPRHHRALDDARACAGIVRLALAEAGPGAVAGHLSADGLGRMASWP
ncbi:MAG: 3'-5' exonuclease [Proteobacteria bacterium]|nr:3'-5' exonuclease [Pseudomonadota bacterium]